ncbi:tetratricopeptide repeat protein [Caulobacter sp. FWC2]|uniref:tetratricopeptide repeat protein n=1 Tax=Caulobacter sp. FWC2 TaxID=69664 RepID=UPI000C14E645|nr:tetratricopeptide repeat protein [Caulobacter sp. FWC2]PIB90516.1 tetratricopeptide repeat protein 38 family protein [Caulobacter sp. FWC2]
MRTDYLGNPVSPTPDAALAAVDGFVDGFLSYETRAAEVIGAAEAYPDCALLNAYAATLWLLLEAPEAAERAAPYLARARAAAGQAHPREQAFVEFVTAWSADDIPGALGVADAILAAWPRDLLVLKLRQYHDFNRGDFPAMLRAASAVLPAAEDVAQLHGMLAFAYEQCHLLDEAEAAARRALTLKRKEPWAQHALAHVMLTQGRIAEGVAFLEVVRDTWTGLNSFMDTHLWWHLALFYLSQGRFDAAMAAYDDHCWAQAKDYSQDQVGAVSLLARLELAGVDVGERWSDLADHLFVRAQDVVQPFLTLQYLYGLARAGRPEAGALLAAVRRAALEAPDFVRETWREVALPAAEGLVAYARGDYPAALRGLRAALPRLAEIGGSHAQRDLFEQLILDALIRADRLSEAQQTLELRRGFDPDGVPLNRALARVYDRLCLPAEAAKARARIA